jgi:oligopeptide transport system ATP-binding protein
VSIQAQILLLLKELQQEMSLSYIFISHDLRVVRHIADEVAVMRKGKIVEVGNINDIYQSPKEEYTRSLLSSIPGQKRLVA